MYSFQIPLFYYGISITSMAVLNIIWNLISSCLVTFVAIFYFKEKITIMKVYGIIFGLISLFIFAIDGIF